MPRGLVELALIAVGPKERVRVALDDSAGRDRIDIRIATRLTAGVDVWVPTARGFAIDVADLPALSAALKAVETAAV